MNSNPTVDVRYNALPAYKQAIWHVVACMLDNAQDADDPAYALLPGSLADTTACYMDGTMHDGHGGCYVLPAQRRLVTMKVIREAVKAVTALEAYEQSWLVSSDRDNGAPPPRTHMTRDGERHCSSVKSWERFGPVVSPEEFELEAAHRRCSFCEHWRQCAAVREEYGTRVDYSCDLRGYELRGKREVPVWHPVNVDKVHVGVWLREAGYFRPSIGTEIRVSGWEDVARAAIKADVLHA